MVNTKMINVELMKKKMSYYNVTILLGVLYLLLQIFLQTNVAANS